MHTFALVLLRHFPVLVLQIPVLQIQLSRQHPHHTATRQSLRCSSRRRATLYASAVYHAADHVSLTARSSVCSSSIKTARLIIGIAGTSTLLRHLRDMLNWLSVPLQHIVYKIALMALDCEKPRPHQLQCRSDIVECYKSNDSFDKVECCFDVCAGVYGA